MLLFLTRAFGAAHNKHRFRRRPNGDVFSKVSVAFRFAGSSSRFRYGRLIVSPPPRVGAVQPSVQVGGVVLEILQGG